MADDTDIQEEKPRRRRGDVGIPDWAKLAATVAATTGTMFLWATSTFVSRAEMNQHMEQQSKDLSRLTSIQEKYADAEHNTARNLGSIDTRLTSMETKMEILINGLGNQNVRNGYQNGKH